MKTAPRRARSAPKKPAAPTALIIVGSLALFAGSFLFASGSILDGTGSLLAATFGAFGKTIVITRSSTSPSGTVLGGIDQNIATFNVQTSGSGWQGNLKKVVVSIPVTGSAASSLVVTNLAAHYNYCIPNGRTYGYGYKGGGCGSAYMRADSVTRNGNVVTVTFSGPLTVYPEQSYGALVISALPYYKGSTGNNTAQVRASVSSVLASGVSCTTVHYGYKNKYTRSQCTNITPNVMLLFPQGNTLTIKNPYGYVKPIIEPPVVNPQALPTTQTTNTTQTTGTTNTGTTQTTQTTGTTQTTNTTDTTQTAAQTKTSTRKGDIIQTVEP